MPDLTVDIVLDGDVVAGTLASGVNDLEIELGTTTSTGTVTEIESVEVSLPGPVSLDGMVRNVGGAEGLLVLDAGAPVPPGTPAGTIILRKE